LVGAAGTGVSVGGGAEVAVLGADVGDFTDVAVGSWTVAVAEALGGRVAVAEGAGVLVAGADVDVLVGTTGVLVGV
jgi:hypothetical protein